MDDKRGDIINELINYYDAPHTDTDAPDESMDHTRVIKKPSEAPPEEVLGSTTSVNIKTIKRKRTAPAAPEVTKKAAIEDGATTQMKTVVKKRRPPEPEEVFGTLGIDGKPIVEKPKETPPEPDIAPAPPEEPNPFVYDRRTPFTRRRDESVWQTLKPLWVTLIVTVSCVLAFKFYITDTGIIGTYKINFQNNMDAIMERFGIDGFGTSDLPVVGSSVTTESPNGAADNTTMTDAGDMVDVENNSSQTIQTENDERESATSQYTTAKADTVILPFDEAGSSDFSVYDNGVVCVKSNYMCYITANGEKKWETALSMNSPIVRTAGKYIAVAASGGTELCLYNGSKLLFTADTDNAIRSCAVSDCGDVALATDRQGYKGAVEVFNAKGEQIYSWASGVNYITALTMMNNRRIALSLSSVVTDVTSYVMVFDIRSDTPQSGVKLENTLVYRLDSRAGLIAAAGDNSLTSMKSNCEIAYDLRFDGALIAHSAFDDTGQAAVVFTADDMPILNVYGSRGKKLYDAVIEAVPDYVDICGKTIVYNNGRRIISGKYTKDDRSLYVAPMNIKGLKLIDSGSYLVIYGDSIEFVKI